MTTAARCDDKKGYLAIFATLLGQFVLVVWWASSLSGSVQQHAKDIQNLDARVAASEDLKKDMAKVQNDIEWIKDWLEKSGRQ